MSCIARVEHLRQCGAEDLKDEFYCSKHHVKNLYLIRTYGINLLSAEQLLDRQGWQCPITGDVLTEGHWVVDHSHRKKKVRGITTRYANHRLIGRHEDWVLVQHIADYLRDPPAYHLMPDQKVPVKKRKKRSKK